MSKMIKISVYEDEQGGRWLRASHDDILRLGFENQISSPNTRMSPQWVYLDATQLVESEAAHFVTRLRKNEPDTPIDYTRHASGVSTIWNMPRYSAAMLNFQPVKGRVVKLGGQLWQVDRVSTAGRGKVFLKSVGSAA